MTECLHGSNVANAPSSPNVPTPITSQPGVSVPSIPSPLPPFSGSDPFWIIIAVSILIGVIKGKPSKIQQ